MGTGLPEAGKTLSVVAANVGSRLPDVSRDVWDYVLAEIPKLRGDEPVLRLLHASVAENVATLLHVFENDIPLDKVEGPVAALEYARRLAQRNVPVSALVRAYRIGHWRFLQWCLEELHGQGVEEDLFAATVWRMLTVSFGYIDRVTEHVIELYQLERDRWLLSQTAGRAARVREILAGQEVDVDWAESALGYRLRQMHLGLVAWLPVPTRGSGGLARLERITGAIAEELNCSARPLFIPRDETSCWAWLPFGSDGEVSFERMWGVAEDGDPSMRVCAGRLEPGVEGFRWTYRQALCAQELATASSSGVRFTAYSRVAPIALMCTNIDDMRIWVRSVLGLLAVDDEPSARLRETVQIFLDTGGSYTATARRQILHKNTVQYRIRKAEEAMGRTVQEQRTDLEVALLAVQYLGSALLIAA
ncbi:helix-turn-helix domain-containing protein [Kitasatospora sp. NPDC004669]|uniref:PucR family transcriptional regulator n=1 Tax=Kitasatospora sp. NPDC004669 TaxID=3154555 RepID=UPI0033A517F1